MEEFRLVVWGLHGIYGCGNDMDEAFGLIETVEKAAMLYMLATASGKRINTISDSQLWEIVEAFHLEDSVRRDFLHPLCMMAIVCHEVVSLPKNHLLLKVKEISSY